MFGRKRLWRDERARGPSPPPHKVLCRSRSPEPGPSRGHEEAWGSILDDLDRLGSHRPGQLLAFLKAHLLSLERTLSSHQLSPPQIRTLLRVLRCVMEEPPEPQDVQPVLEALLQPPFLLQSLLEFVARLETFCSEGGQISQVVGDTVATLHHLLTAFPSQAQTLICYPLDLLFTTVRRLQSRDFQLTWIVRKRLWDAKALLDRAFPNQWEPSVASPADREDFRRIPIFPTAEDIFLEPTRKLKPNIKSGRYQSDAAYLDTHFRLLREDLVKPLRDGISAQFTLPNHFSGSERARGDGLLLYPNVRLVEVGTSFSGTMYLARYSTKKRAAPFSSRRLLGGSLVCLISNDSDQVLFGTVAGANRKEALHGAVWLELRCSHRFLQGHLGRTHFTMVESPAFFEAYRHVLEGLQKGFGSQVPFSRYIVKCRHDVSQPAYLEGKAVTFDLSALRSPGSKSGALEVGMGGAPTMKIPAGDLTAMNPLCDHVWSPEMFPHLDESQISAIRMALSREFVLIQGPPGTGKTFIGLKILQVLLANQALWNQDCTPCLVVCYTNHALDQFLEGTLQFQKSGIVRVGGRSKSEALALFSLRNLRKQMLGHRGLLLLEKKKLYGRTLRFLTDRKKSIAEHMEVLKLLDCAILKEEELEAMILEDNLRIPQGGLLQWLKIYPPKERGTSQRPRTCRRAADSDFIQWDKDERFLDDYDNDFDNMEARTTPESKFAYILPAEESATRTKILDCLREKDIMSSQEVAEIQTPQELWLRDRWRLYRRWVATYKEQLKAALVEELEAYEKKAASLQELTFEEDLSILKRSRVIGMTTTGAAKYRKLLQNIHPRIVVVEEAAEILEAHVLTALTTSCQHLILIGDHQQLRPKPADYTLEKKYFLGISLFERMVNNRLPYVQLLYQHRMRPEISQLLVPLFYKELRDHAAVLDYEKIKGIDKSVFFIQHHERESQSVDSESYSNPHEASFLVSLTSYLLKQGYSKSQITVLSPYQGQVVKIRTLLKQEGLEEVAAHAVDDFQGEENDIVLLSLVRSNRQGKTGFLKDKNRLCVALSRAKRGFYCVGDLGCLSAGSGLWKELTLLLQSKGLLGEELTLVCQNHPDTKTAVKCSADFSQLPEGGCALECQTRLDCGHPCARHCHPHDREHLTIMCRFPCSRELCELKHKCPGKCSEACRPCSVKVEKVIPKCGHSQMVPCHVPAEAWACKEPCQRLQECSHPCKLLCGQDCRTAACKERVQVTLPCSHTTQTDCFRQKMPLRCYEKCQQTLECGHKCQGSCYECLQGRLHAACRKKCTRVLLCAHVCRGSCCENCPPCERECLRKCSHSRCGKLCGEMCVPCVQPCAWACRHHKCTQACSDLCDRPRCNEPCPKTLRCKHPCVGLCGEPCPPKCRLCHRDELTEIFFGDEDEPEARFVVLEDCGHVFEVGGLDHWMDGAPDAGGAQRVQQQVCSRCSTPVQHHPRYSRLLKAQQQQMDEIKEKIQGSKLELQAGKMDLLSKLATIPPGSPFFRRGDWRRQIARTPSLQSLRSWENTVSFLQSLQRLNLQAEKCSQERREHLKGCTAAVEAWLGSRRGGDAFTAQQLREGRNEIKRISYLANVFVRLSSLQHPPGAQLPSEASAAVGEALALLDQQKPFTDVEEERLQATLAKIDELLPASGMLLSEAERVSIVEAMRFRKGHWYSCPRGHLYTVGECGWPMQESRCPECGAAIGGRDHRLDRSNVSADSQMLSPVEGRRGGGSCLGNIVELVGPLAPSLHQLSSRREVRPPSPGETPTSPCCVQHSPMGAEASPPDSPSPPLSTCPGPASAGEDSSEEGGQMGSAAPEGLSPFEGDPTSLGQPSSPSNPSGSPREAVPDPSDCLLPPRSPSASPSKTPTWHTLTTTEANLPSAPHLLTRQPDSPSSPLSTCPGPASAGEDSSEEGSQMGSAAPEVPSPSDGVPLPSLQSQAPGRALGEHQDSPQVDSRTPLLPPQDPSHGEGNAQVNPNARRRSARLAAQHAPKASPASKRKTAL
ncbi:NFX1-type zinc finger-containing protein 1-like [Heteronotia binoei]|uniref:NFX1-type zinc finger-containing protein 1-like n=1 Tax=Heteronotia binoei TaxID=13085 RepID=UPI0029307CD9|nr:NFX1-type zinc finger-containing protein 1-like [Heteronotia binoei]